MPRELPRQVADAFETMHDDVDDRHEVTEVDDDASEEEDDDDPDDFDDNDDDDELDEDEDEDPEPSKPRKRKKRSRNERVKAQRDRYRDAVGTPEQAEALARFAAEYAANQNRSSPSSVTANNQPKTATGTSSSSSDSDDLYKKIAGLEERLSQQDANTQIDKMRDHPKLGLAFQEAEEDGKLRKVYDLANRGVPLEKAFKLECGAYIRRVRDRGKNRSSTKSGNKRPNKRKPKTSVDGAKDKMRSAKTKAQHQSAAVAFMDAYLPEDAFGRNK